MPALSSLYVVNEADLHGAEQIARARAMSFAEEVKPIVSMDPRAPGQGVSTRTVARAATGRIVRKEGKAPNRRSDATG